jgi:hypothetical protein
VPRHGLLQRGHQVDDLARGGLLLGRLGRLHVLPLRLDQLLHRLRVPVGELVSFEVLTGHPVDEVLRLFDLGVVWLVTLTELTLEYSQVSGLFC